jgi:hypothetical protein
VQSVEEPLDDDARDELEVVDPGEDRRIEQPGAGKCRVTWRRWHFLLLLLSI